MGFAGGVIASLNPKTLTVTRTSGGRYVRGRYVPAPQLDANVVLDGALDTVTLAAHGMVTGDGPVQLRTSGTLPTGLSSTAYYWVIRIDANTFKLAVSYAAAIALVPVLFASDGTGTHGALAPRTFPIVAGVQPAGGRDIDWLPAGMNANETLVLYTEALLIPVMPAGGGTPDREPDMVTIPWLGQTEDWTVQKVEQFDILAGHYRVAVFRTVVP